MTTTIGQHRFRTLAPPSLSEAPGAANYLKLLNDEIARSFNPIRSVADGGTGTDTFVLGDLLYADAANSLARRAIGGAGTVLTVSGGVPAWVAPGGTLDALTDVTITAVADQQTLRYDAGTAQWINESVLKVGVADVTLSGQLIFSTALTQVVPGATSLSFRNTADTADNLLIANAGDVTLRLRLLFATAISKIIPGATSISLRNAADSADNLLVADAGAITFRGALAGATTASLAGPITLTTAASKIIPGATSLSFRNTADSADNLLIANAGGVTLRTTLTFATAASQIIPGATSFAIRNTANSADNFLLTNVGDITVPNGALTAAGQLSSFWGTDGSSSDEHIRWGKTGAGASGNPYYMFKTDAAAQAVSQLAGWNGTTQITFMTTDYATGNTTFPVSVGEVIIGTDPGGTGVLRIGGSVDMLGGQAFWSAGTSRWNIGLSGAGGFQVQANSGAASTHVFWLNSAGATKGDLDCATGALILSGALTISDATLIKTNTAFTNGAAAAAGTLGNAPVAGNPTKWIPVNDNGTTRYIPAW